MEAHVYSQRQLMWLEGRERTVTWLSVYNISLQQAQRGKYSPHAAVPLSQTTVKNKTLERVRKHFSMVTLQILGCEITPVPASDRTNYILLANLVIFHEFGDAIKVPLRYILEGHRWRQTSTTQPLLEAPFAAVPASFWLWRQPGRTWRYSDFGLRRFSLGGLKTGCPQTCLKHHIWFSSSLSLDLPTSSCPSALDKCPCPPRLHFQTRCSELVRSLNGLILVPSVQMSDPVSEKPDTLRGTPCLCPLDCSVLWESLGCLRMMKTSSRCWESFQAVLLPSWLGVTWVVLCWAQTQSRDAEEPPELKVWRDF